jgi:signal transduction histidine kinase
VTTHALGPVDRSPPLDELARREDLERCLAPFVDDVVDGVMLFGVDGVPHAGRAADRSPLARWEQAPPEAITASHARGSFGFDDHVFDVRPVYASTDRVGLLVISRRADLCQPRDERLADALGDVVSQLLQAGYATWVTSQLHMAVSESSSRALAQRNAELERAVVHLREVDELKSNFLATVSHELRTPLTSVIGFSEMLLDGLAGELAPEQADYVRTIMARGEELLALITQVLEMSKLESGAVRLDLRVHPLAHIVQRAVQTIEVSAERAGVEIVVEDEFITTVRVLADAEKVQRILLNLLGNAIKFSPEGGQVSICAQAAPIKRPFREETLFGEEADDALRITVRDAGQGIPDDQLERVFEAFYQADSTSTRQHGGAGLGLSIVKSLVSAHGGDVWVESQVGIGTAVHFTLPIASDAALAEPRGAAGDG